MRLTFRQYSKRGTKSYDGTAAKPRMWFLDNLKALLCIIVIAYHSGLLFWPKSMVSNWAFWSPLSAALLGCFFFISAYFTPSSLARKGTLRYCQSRLLRLGVPLAAWILLMVILVREILYAHMWFVADLLVCNLLYAFWCWCQPLQPRYAPCSRPRTLAICAVILWIGGMTATVRLVCPVGMWKTVGYIFPMAFAHGPEYLGFFVLGLWAARTGWLRNFDLPQCRNWLILGLTGSALGLLYALHPGPFAGIFSVGGVNFSSVFFSLFETFVCIGLVMGFLGIFRKYFDRELPVWRVLVRNSYGIYIVHAVVIQRGHYYLGRFPIPPLMQYFLTVAAGLFLSMLISEFILCRVPYLKTICRVYYNSKDTLRAIIPSKGGSSPRPPLASPNEG
ncbi:MAG: acyltransferase [Chthoniobacterales bacterium]